MTKHRPPLSFELAIIRVADRIGWGRMGEISGQAERTVRNWSDPDTGPAAGAAITLDHALAFDVAYQKAGGEGSPFLHCFATRVETAVIDACSDCVAIARSAGTVAKESGEAIRAAITASLPGAKPGDLAIAERELEQSIDAHHVTLAAIRAARSPSRGPEVPPTPPAKDD